MVVMEEGRKRERKERDSAAFTAFYLEIITFTLMLFIFEFYICCAIVHIVILFCMSYQALFVLNVFYFHYFKKNRMNF